MRRQVYWLAGGRIGGAVLQAVNLGVLARLTGPSDFGLTAGVLGIAQASIAFADLGVSPSLLRLRAQDPDEPRVIHMLALNRRIARCLGLAWAVALCAAIALGAGEVPALLLPVAIWVACEKTTETRLMIPLADGRTTILLTSIILRRATCLIVFLSALAAGESPLLAYSTGLGAAGIAGVLHARARILRSLPAPTGPPQRSRSLLRPALPFWIATLAAQARLLDVTVVGAFAGARTAGLYAVPSRLTGPLSLLPNSIAQVLLPAAAKEDRVGLRALWKSLAVVTVGTIAVFLALALCATQIITLLLGDAFAPAAPAFRMILFGLVFLSLSASMISLLQARGDEWFVAGATATATVLGLAGAAIGGMWAGPLGAATGSALSYCLQASLLVVRIVNNRRRMALSAHRSLRPDRT